MTTVKLESPVEEAILSPKEQVLEGVRNLPDNVTFEEILYWVDLMERLRLSDEDVREGRVYTHEEARALMDKWLTA